MPSPSALAPACRAVAPGRIGLGAVTFGREIDAAASLALMDHAVSRGVRHFDTAAAYGQGASEQLVGRWWAERRPGDDAVLVATKVLPPYTRDSLAAAIEASMRRLAPAQIGLLYLHRWDDALDRPGAVEEVAQVAAEHGVARLGASNFTTAQLSRTLGRLQAGGRAGWHAVQNNHNYAVSAFDAGLLAFCAAAGVAPFGYSPLGAGFLTGKHRAGVVPGSRFDVIPGHQQIYFTVEARSRLARLEAVAQATGHTPVALALAWALQRPEVTVLVGGRTPGHLDQACAALAFADRAALAALDAE